MIRKNLLIALRSFYKQRTITLINLFGLALSITAFSLIIFYVTDTLKADKFHENYDRIFRFKSGESYALTTINYADILRGKDTGVEEIVRTHPKRRSLNYGLKAFNTLINFVDPGFFRMFTFEALQGDLKSALDDPYTVVITESYKNKMFGDENPIGQIIKYENQLDLHVTAVIKDAPHKTHLYAQDCFASFETLRNPTFGVNFSNTGYHNYLSYVLFPSDYKETNFMESFQLTMDQIEEEFGYHLLLQGMDEIYFKYKGFDYSLNGDYGLVYTLLGASILILIIACFNFMNLTTASSTVRNKEIGLKKVLGSHRRNISSQFLGESILMCYLAGIIGVVLIGLLAPGFKSFFEIKTSPFTITNIAFYIAFLTFLGLISGWYPARYLSGFGALGLVKGELRNGGKGKTFRLVLILIQFSIGLILILCTAFIFKQFKYIENNNTGFETENVVCFKNPPQIIQKSAIFKQKLLESPYIEEVGYSWARIGTEFSRYGWKDKNEVSHGYSPFYTDPDFIDLMKIKIVQGRNFSWDNPSDTSCILVNQKAVEEFGWEDNPLDKEVNGLRCIGVVEDYHIKSFKYEMEEQVLFFDPGNFAFTNLKLMKDKEKEALEHIEQVFNEIAPGVSYDVLYYEDIPKLQYKDEMKVSKIIMYFSILSLIIALMGFYGMATFIVNQKRKEIGIRKTLGAETATVMRSMSFYFLKWILISSLIAVPISYYMSADWMKAFVYKTELSAWLFALIILLVLFFAQVTVFYKTYITAKTSPAHTLRYE